MRTVIATLLVGACLVNVASAHAPPKKDTRVFLPMKEAQIEQNRIIEEKHLLRIKDDKQFRNLLSSGYLVPIVGSALAFDPRLPYVRRACLPQTLNLLNEIASQYYKTFNKSLVITSAIRPMTVQRKLLRRNKNAAPLHGETASSHPTGATVDVSRRRMTAAQIKFTEDLLLEYARMGKVIVIEEKQQLCFHIFVIPQETLPH